MVACALGVEVMMVGAGAEARFADVECALARFDLLRFSTPILRRLVERSSADTAWRFEPTAASGVKVKIAPVRRKGEGWGWGAGNEKEKEKVLG